MGYRLVRVYGSTRFIKISVIFIAQSWVLVFFFTRLILCIVYSLVYINYISNNIWFQLFSVGTSLGGRSICASDVGGKRAQYITQVVWNVEYIYIGEKGTACRA